MMKLLRRVFSLGVLLVVLGLWFKVQHLAPTPNMNPKYPVIQINPKSLESVKHFIVLISNEGLMGISRGTGVIISPNYVLTCAHLVPQEDQEMWLYTYPIGTVLKGKVQYQENYTDLALIKLNHPVKLPFYPRFQDVMDEGEPLVVIGNILGSMRWFVSYGTNCGTDVNYILTDALIHGGNSGGPWFNYRGEIVALTDWGMTSNGKEVGISGGISSKTIHQFLKNSKHPNPFLMFFQSLSMKVPK